MLRSLWTLQAIIACLCFINRGLMRKGIKTSEFWIMVLTIIASLAADLSSVLDSKSAGALIVVSTVAYSISRGLAKSGGH